MKKFKGLKKINIDKKAVLSFFARYAVLIAICAMVTVIIETACQAKLLMLEPGELSITEIKDEDVTINDKVVVVNLGGRYVDKLTYSFDYEGLVNAKINIVADNIYGKEQVFKDEDHCSSLLEQSVINIGKKVNRVEFTFLSPVVLDDDSVDPKEVINITSFGVDNTVEINWYRVCFIAASVFLAGFIFMERKRLAKRVEVIFLVIGLVAGSIMILCMPTSKIGWDDEIHFLRAYSISVYPGAIEVNEKFTHWFVASDDTWPFNLPDSVEEMKDYMESTDEICSYNSAEIHMDSGLGFPYFTGYLAQAFGIKVARNLGMSFTMMYQMGRLANLIMYCIVMAFAIWRLPRGKWIMAVIGLMPTTLFLACTYSYDATVTSFLYVSLAYLLHMMLTPDYKFRWRDYLIMGAAFVIGCLPKSVYAPLALLGLMIPSRVFKNKAQMIIAKLGLVGAFAFMICANILPTVLAPSDVGDSRGGETSEAGQMTYILGQPVQYAVVLVRNIFKTLPEYFAGAPTFGFLGHLSASPLYYWICAFMFSVMFTDTEGRDENVESLKAKQKIFMFVIVAMTAVLIWTALYMSYTVPGSIDIQGVQGRYYIPILFITYLVFNNTNIKNRIDKAWYNVVVSGASAFILMFTVWKCIVSVICL